MTIKQNNKTGIIFNIQRFSIHDGPGIRTVVFFKGCPLRCLWCFNPESQKKDIEIGIFKSICKSCKSCLNVCPTGAISIIKDSPRINKKKCTGCHRCVSSCPEGAIRVIGRRVSVDEILEEVEKDSLFYRNSGGGITISGGEPTYQICFLEELLKESKKRNLNTAIETCGYFKWESFARIIKYLDLILFDIKLFDEKKHIEYTGVSNLQILENAKKIINEKLNVKFRFPLIPGYNIDNGNIFSLQKFLNEMNVKEVSILPFSNLGTPKYEAISRDYKLKNVKSLDKKEVDRIYTCLCNYGIKATIGY